MSSVSTFWNPARLAETIERYGSGESFGAIAKHFGAGRGAISGMLARLQQETPTWTPDSDSRLCDLLSIGKSLDEAAWFMGVRAEAVAVRFALIRRAMGRQAI